MNQARPPVDWIKSWAVSSPEYYTIAVHYRILDHVVTLIGKDVLLWGAQLLARKPGEVHPWHTDIETSSPSGQTVSVWIGLANTNVRSSLKVAPYSHHFGIALQEVMQEKRVARESVKDSDVSNWARERDERSGLLQLNTTDGEAVFFDGRLWHGSHNSNTEETRYALLLQYATPSTAIRIPNFNKLTWPFEVYETPKPPCILVSGSDHHGTNRIVSAPASGYDRSIPSLSHRVHPLRLPLEQDPKVGWKPHHLFRGSTPDIRTMGCHVSILDPGRQPHPPHRHDEEEILMILDGEAELVLEDATDREQVGRHCVRHGNFTYYPAGFAHTIHNTSREPVTYVMFKWKSDRLPQGSFMKHQFISLPDSISSKQDAESSDFTTRPLMHGETECLRRLHAHMTRLQPGCGYDPHVDPYDVAIVMLEGTVETLGQQISAPGVIFYAAGQPHGIKNVGDLPAVYVVFEFHGRHSDLPSLPTPSFSHRLRNVLRNPKRLRNALARRFR